MNIADLFYSVKAEGLEKVANQIDNLGNMVGDIGGLLTENISKPLLNFFTDGIDLASDVAESINVVKVTFGKSADEVANWSTQLLDSFGLTEKEALQYVASMGAMLKSSGLQTDASRNMSKSLVELAGDVSSFYNLDHDEAWEKIRSGISGETEPLKVLGVNMTVANLQSYALSKGIKKSYQEMNQAEQVSLRYGFIMKSLADSQGDFSRTQDGFANKLRVVKGRLDDFAKQIGEVLLPYVEKAINFFDDFIQKLMVSVPGLDKLTIIFGLLAVAIGPILIALSGLILGFGGVIGAITAVVALISTVGMPIFIGIAGAVIWLAGWLTILGGAFTIVTTTIGALIIKTGVLQWVFESIKTLFGTFAAVLNNDINTALKLLTENFGMTKQEATDFYFKIKDAKESLFAFGEMVKNITAYLGAIFSEDAKKQVDILVEKFGYTKQEATELTNKIKELRGKITEFGEKLKEVAADGIAKFLGVLKDLLNWIYDNRKEIIKFIEKVIDLGIKAYNLSVAIVKAFNIIKNVISTSVNIIKLIISTLITKWLELVKIVSNTEAFKTLKTVFNASLGTGIELVKTAISKWLELKDAVLKVVSALSKVVFPGSGLIKGFADGVRNFGGGWAVVGEEGAELVELPQGSNVYDHQTSRRMLNSSSNNNNNNYTSGGNTYNVNMSVNIDDIEDVTNVVELFKRLNLEPEY